MFTYPSPMYAIKFNQKGKNWDHNMNISWGTKKKKKGFKAFKPELKSELAIYSSIFISQTMRLKAEVHNTWKYYFSE